MLSVSSPTGEGRSSGIVAVIVAGVFLAGCSTAGDLGGLLQTAAAIDRTPAMYGAVTDGGHNIQSVKGRLPVQYQRQEVITPRKVAAYGPGTIVVDTSRRYLYLVQKGGTSMRYGIGVGRAGFAWAGEATIRAKRRWPSWHPPKEMQERDPLAAEWAGGMPGGLANPLGARALYLFQGGRDTLYRLHGTNDPRSIGKAVSSGCVRLVNQDIMDLYKRVPVGTKVVVLGQPEFNFDSVGAFFSSLIDV